MPMTEDTEVKLYKKLDSLRRLHHALEQKIHDTVKQVPQDEFSIQRYKKEKLAIRDQITSIESILYPNITA
jgi:hypothetical protein